MTIEFKGAVLREAGLAQPYATSRPLSVERVCAQPPREGEALVRIKAASLCRSDLSVVNGVRAWPMPIIPGHEAAGIVEEVGPATRSVKKGDHVVLVFQPHCGACPDCVSGHVHLCAPGLAANRRGELLGGGTRLVANGEAAVHHHMGLSAFAQYAVISEHSAVAISKEVPFDVAALFGCAVMCGAGTVLNTGAIRPGDSVAIIGLGGVGTSAALGAALAGAGRVFAVDRDESRLEAAAGLGISATIADSDGTAAQQILELSGGGVDFAFETAGTLGAFETAYGAVRRGGTVVSVGLVDPKTPFALDIAGLVTGAKTVKGSYMGSCNPALDIPKYVGLYAGGHFPVEKLISHHLPLAEVNTALDRMAKNEALRQIIEP